MTGFLFDVAISNGALAALGAISTIGAGVGLAFLTARAKSVDVWKDVAMGRQEQVEDRDGIIREQLSENAALTAKVEKLESDIRALEQRDQAAVLAALRKHETAAERRAHATQALLERIATALEGGRA